MQHHRPINLAEKCEFDRRAGAARVNPGSYASWPVVRRPKIMRVAGIQRCRLLDLIMLLVMGACSLVALIDGMRQVIGLAG